MIAFNDVTKQYGSVPAVSQARFSLEPGEFFALLGPNGAGKTTLVKMALDLVRPTQGEITIGSLSSRNPQSRASVGYLAENARMPGYLTGWEFLVRQGILAGLSRQNSAAQARGLLDRVGMKGKEHQRLGTCSKGMTQRIGLAAALIASPRLLILDEPASGLDPLGIREIREILESLRPDATTVFINSHLLSEVEKICDTAAIINRGHILVKDRIDRIVREGESLEDVFVRMMRGSA